MRIAVNTRLLLEGKLEGIGWFTYETLQRITQQHPGHEFIFLFDRSYSKQFIFSDNITPVVIPPQSRRPILWWMWFEWAVPWALKKHKADLFLSPDGYLSLKTDVPSVNVVHDLNFEQFPDDLPPSYSRYYRKYFPQYAQKAQRVATVSEYSKQDIVNRYGVNADKIDVVYNGCNKLYGPITNEEIAQTRKQYSQNSPYFLFIGALHPRKNLINLFKSFDQFRAKNDMDTKLLVVGGKMWWTETIRQAYEQMQYKQEVVFTGRLEAAQLKNVIASALALTYVSFFEGFGIPIVEAMNSNVPVITSNVTSMPEVAGDAALLVDPSSVDSIANAMGQVANDEDLRTQLIEKGRERGKTFTWDRTASLLWESLIRASK